MDMQQNDSVSAPAAGDTAAGVADARRSRLIGIALMCGAVVCFACLDASAKWLIQFMDPLQTVWARYVSSVVIIAAFLNPWTRQGLFVTRRPWLQAGRSLLLVLSTALNFVALIYLQLAQTTAILFATPLIVALIAGPLIGEWPGPRRLIAIGVGFLGVILVAQPGFGGIHWAAGLSVLGSLCYALYNIATRSLAGTDSAATTMTYSGIAGALIMTPLMPFVWTDPASPAIWLMMAATGVFGGLGHWLLILAHERVPAPILAPFIYTQLVWMVAFGYFIFGDVPDVGTLAGGAVVIASGLYLLSRERAVGLRTH